MKRLITRSKNSLIKRIITLSGHLNLVKRTPLNAPLSKFLVISTTGIGDTLWGTPAIKALRETYPESYIGVLTNKVGSELLQGNPDIDKLFVFKRGLEGLLSLPFLLRALKQKKFEVAFIFHASDRIIWPLAFFTGAGKIIGVDGNSKGLDFILTNPVTLSQLHGIEARLALVKQVGATAKQKAIEMFLTERDRGWAEQLFRDKGIAKGSLIAGLHPGAQKPYKCWPARNFIVAGNIFVERYGCRIVVTGDSHEKALADEIASKIRGAISTAGELSLRETASIIEKMNVFITNDTGPMHIAFALKTPTVALFSPTDPRICGPYRDEKPIVIEKPKTCTPCIGKKCDNPICMEQITVDVVIEAAESLLKSIKLKKEVSRSF